MHCEFDGSVRRNGLDRRGQAGGCGRQAADSRMRLSSGIGRFMSCGCRLARNLGGCPEVLRRPDWFVFDSSHGFPGQRCRPLASL